jgi:hypothetical protein
VNPNSHEVSLASDAHATARKSALGQEVEPAKPGILAGG